MTFKQFLKVGRFGCSHCYTAFKDTINPNFKRFIVETGHIMGKFQSELVEQCILRKNIEDLKMQLQQLIAT